MATAINIFSDVIENDGDEARGCGFTSADQRGGLSEAVAFELRRRKKRSQPLKEPGSSMQRKQRMQKP